MSHRPTPMKWSGSALLPTKRSEHPLPPSKIFSHFRCPVTASRPDLAQILADAREEAQVLRRTGNVGQAEYLDALVSKVRDAAEDFLTWLTEADAILKSGLTERALRRRFRELLDSGLARYGAKGKREYLACAVPNRPEVRAQRAKGLAA